METLTLEQAYYIGELITTFAVIISLVYVGIQIRQNTHAIKLTSAQNLFHEYRDSQALLVADAELADIHLRAIQDINSLSLGEKHRLYLWLNNLFRVFENAHYQNSKGTVDKPVWDGMLGYIKLIKKLSGYQAFWNDRKSIYNNEFQEFYDSVESGNVIATDAYQERAQ